MSTPFLDAFSRALVHRLVEDRELVIADRSFEAVVAYLAEDLAADRAGRSLVSTVSRALLGCPNVLDLFLDDEGIKATIDDLGTVGG